MISSGQSSIEAAMFARIIIDHADFGIIAALVGASVLQFDSLRNYVHQA